MTEGEYLLFWAAVPGVESAWLPLEDVRRRNRNGMGPGASRTVRFVGNQRERKTL